MASTLDSKSYDYCHLCRVNHQQGLKHVYSQKHQKTIEYILRKFGSKVKEARTLSKFPIIENIGYETGVKYWCYFCTSEVEKHEKRENGVIKLAKFIEHLSRTEHRLNLELFWKTHKVKRDDLHKFAVSSDEMERFKQKSEEALKSHQARMQHAIALEAQRIMFNEASRTRILNAHSSKFGLEQDHHRSRSQGSCNIDPPSSTVHHNTAHSVREGFTYIGKVSKHKCDNVHSGGIPPWLQVDDKSHDRSHDNASQESTRIGPTIEDLEKHKSLEQKRKLPADRVGAKDVTDMSATTSQMWLPSFGGVWNRGRRETSKQQFLRRHAKRKGNPY